MNIMLAGYGRWGNVKPILPTTAQMGRTSGVRMDSSTKTPPFRSKHSKRVHHALLEITVTQSPLRLTHGARRQLAQQAMSALTTRLALLISLRNLVTK